jgi:hypothetical protein
MHRRLDENLRAWRRIFTLAVQSHRDAEKGSDFDKMTPAATVCPLCGWRRAYFIESV